MQKSSKACSGATREIPLLPSQERSLPSNETYQKSESLASTQFPDDIGSYRIIRKLGSGGMGAVYLAEVSADQSLVAIKVLSEILTKDSSAVSRFQKEGRLLSEINHPHVTNLYEINEYEQRLFMAIEYVPGCDLDQLMQNSDRLPEKTALKIIRDVADALSCAHKKGIIHRDIKPANILLAASSGSEDSSEESIAKSVFSGEHPIVKLTDFGLARHMDQSDSLALTKTGAVLGTPYFLAPEQCMEIERVQPATDIYSLGVTLFLMLTGRLPFQADDAVKLVTMHCFDEPPDLRKVNPEVSDATAELVNRCLSKVPKERFLDGEQLCDAIDRILRGELPHQNHHPILPEATGRLIETSWEWKLTCSAEELWPYVSNTERINNAIGLPPVEYTTQRDEHGDIIKLGAFRLGWANLEWHEHPFEWVEGKRLGVLREFKSSPFHWFSSLVELHPQIDGKTRLVHHVKIAPRGLLGQLLAFLEVNIKGRRKLDEIYPRIDQIVSEQIVFKGHSDPFLPPARSKKRIQTRLNKKISQVQQQETDYRSLNALHGYLLSAPSQEIARIRPYALADMFDCDRKEMAEVSLHACMQGILELHWDILCPTCRISTCVKDTLAEIKKHVRCEACNLDFEVDFQNAVEMIFRAHPDIRKTDLKTYCAGGPEHAPHVISQTKLQPGEMLELDLSLDSGNYLIRGPQLPYTIPVRVHSNATDHTCLLTLSSREDSSQNVALLPGRQRFMIKNEYRLPILLRFERTIRKDDVLTAAEASQLELFRQLFPEQVLKDEQLMNYSTCTILGIQINGIDDLYLNSGDAGALHCIQTEMKFLKQIVELHGGSVTRSQDDSMLVIFQETTQAVILAEKLLERSMHATDALSLGLVLHRGNALAKTMNGKLDYYGRAVITAGALMQSIPAHTLHLSEQASRDSDLIAAISESQLMATNYKSGFIYAPKSPPLEASNSSSQSA